MLTDRGRFPVSGRFPGVDNGNFVLDVDFGALVGEKAPAKLNQAILNIPGVVDTGLFIGLVHKCYVGTETGSVETF